MTTQATLARGKLLTAEEQLGQTHSVEEESGEREDNSRTLNSPSKGVYDCGLYSANLILVFGMKVPGAGAALGPFLS